MGRLILLLFLLAGCRLTGHQDEVIEETVENGEEEAATSSSATLPAQDEPVTPAKSVELADPEPRDLKRLHTWLAAQDTGFDIERLDDCAAQLLIRADRVQNKADIKKAADDLQADVRDTLPLYHWCYYHMLGRLEYQLEQQSLGRTYQDKLQQFLRESKALFIAAECLDRSRQTRRYRSTLQKKYIEMSQAWFGRNLSPTEATGRSEMKKSAAPFEDK